MERVLIFSDHEDNHCKKIASILKDMNIGVDIIDPILLYSPNSGEKLLGDSINIQEDLVSCLGISDGFDKYSGVWMRRLGAPYVARCQYQADDEYLKKFFRLITIGCVVH